MIPYLAEMKAIYDDTERDPAWRNAEFDPPTVCWNIGINDHTRAVNITPPQSICTIYFRPMPGQDASILIERARRAAIANGLDFDVKIKDLETQISKDTSAAGADAKRQAKELTDLKAARAKASKSADELSKASKESWEGAQKAFHDSYKDLQKSYDAAVAKLKK